jgi:lipoprotein-anchoring transpeptidase ErfK/SrfK
VALVCGLAAVMALIVATVLLLVPLASPSSSPSPEADEPVHPLPAAPAPAFAVPTPVLLSASDDVSIWAPVVRGVVARKLPDAGAPAVVRLATRTPEGTSNIVLALERAEGTQETTWVKVRLPVLSGETTGWVPRRVLGGYGVVRTRLVVDLETFAATLYRDGRRIFAAKVGIGKTRWPTPKGHFYIRNRLERYRSPFYGPVAFGTSARSEILTDWPADGFVGIHGTNRPEILPGRVSHGCIRMRNEDIVELSRLMPVGTPLTIR